MAIDYSLYLVTDSTPAILGSRPITEVVESALKGGVTLVQYRKKTGDTADLIKEARQLHQITRKYNVPLLINDRVDVAVAVGAEGVHIGQDDIDIDTARRLLSHLSTPIIGVTASSIPEALAAAKAGATYLGVGTVFATPTKTDTKSIIGTAGVRDILSALHKEGYRPPCVCIGGINASNIQRVLHQSSIEKLKLSGAAVVSAIMAAEDPGEASRKLKSLIATPPPFASASARIDLTSDMVHSKIRDYIKQVVEKKPLCHNMTNTVVQTLAANIAIAIGGSPIMSGNGDEAVDLAKLGGSLVINMGTVTPESIKHYLKALQAYNAAGNPVLFDPVGGGATSLRKQAMKTLMAGGYFDVIKGNEGEIKAVAGTLGAEQQRGVDSGTSTLSLDKKALIVEDLARKEQCVILMTGEVDVLSDGKRTAFVRNGHEFMGLVTGSGCTLGTVIAAFIAVHREDKLLAALIAILLFEIAAEEAVKENGVNGPGTFIPAWVDSLYLISQACLKGSQTPFASTKLEFRNVPPPE